jgi:hypothetical protein
MKSFLSDPSFKLILPKTKEQFNRQFDVIFGELEKLNLEKYYICETGCIRSTTQFDWQGNFTILANNFLEFHDGIIYTCNVDYDAINLCKDLSKTKASLMDSILFLSTLNEINEVNLFYLDSMDIDKLNPIPSMKHHYDEFLTLIENRKHGNFYLAVDDNISDDIQKGYYVNKLMEKLKINPLLHSYQTMYWIDQCNFECIKRDII